MVWTDSERDRLWWVCDTGSRDQAQLGLQFPCAYHRFLGVLDPDRTSKSYLGSVVSNNGRQNFHDIALWSTPSGSLNQLKQPCRMTYVDWCSYDLFKHAGLCQMLHDPNSTTTMPLITTRRLKNPRSENDNKCHLFLTRKNELVTSSLKYLFFVLHVFPSCNLLPRFTPKIEFSSLGHPG